MGDVFVTMLAYRKFFPNCAWKASFVINLVAAVTAETPIDFTVIKGH
jgi:hypothetical protein